jgi:hypothetical protein
MLIKKKKKKRWFTEVYATIQNTKQKAKSSSGETPTICQEKLLHVLQRSTFEMYATTATTAAREPTHHILVDDCTCSPISATTTSTAQRKPTPHIRVYQYHCDSSQQPEVPMRLAISTNFCKDDIDFSASDSARQAVPLS